MFAGFLAMRPLHRPVHSKLIFNNDWVRMSQKQQEEATKQGMLRLPTPKQIRNMKKSEINELRAKFRPFFEEMKEEALVVFKSFPPSLMLVCR